MAGESKNNQNKPQKEKVNTSINDSTKLTHSNNPSVNEIPTVTENEGDNDDEGIKIVAET